MTGASSIECCLFAESKITHCLYSWDDLQVHEMSIKFRILTLPWCKSVIHSKESWISGSTNIS
jgi:hypothetical protein